MKRGMGESLLGRLQGSDVGRVSDVDTDDSRVHDLPIDEVDVSPFQARSRFEADSLRELADSIEKQGVLQPVLVRPVEGRWELLAGERRLRAAAMAGLDTIPATVREVDDVTAAAIGLTENLAREDLTAWERATGLRKLKAALKEKTGIVPTVRGLSDVTGLPVGTVSEGLRVADRITEDVIAAAGVQNLNTLPHTALRDAAMGETKAERVDVLRAAVKSDESPGKAARQAREKQEPKTGRPEKPYTLTARKDGRVQFQLRRPASELEAEEAQEILSRLEPMLDQLRERAGL